MLATRGKSPILRPVEVRMERKGGETRDNHVTKDLNKEEGNMASAAH
jgi:hypothetical protein